ncbi:hypothetical protein HK405_005936, partial [Cladochytrium tenue]
MPRPFDHDLDETTFEFDPLDPDFAPAAPANRGQDFNPEEFVDGGLANHVEGDDYSDDDGASE